MPGYNLAMDLQRRMSQHFCSSSQPAAGSKQRRVACLQQRRSATAAQPATFLVAAEQPWPAAAAMSSGRPLMRLSVQLKTCLNPCGSRQISTWRSGGRSIPRGRNGSWSGWRLGLDLSSDCRAKRIACQALLGGASLPLPALQAASETPFTLCALLMICLLKLSAEEIYPADTHCRWHMSEHLL